METEPTTPAPPEPRQGAPAPGARPEAEAEPFPAARVPWTVVQALLVLCLTVLAQAVLAWLGGQLLVPPGRKAPTAALMGFVLAGGSALSLGLVCWLLCARCGGVREASRLVGLRVPRPGRALLGSLLPLAAGAAIYLACLEVQGRLLEALHARLPEQLVVQELRGLAGRGDWGQVAALFVLAVAVAPVTEELLFRGVLYLPLRSALGPRPAALLAAVAFAVVHPPIAAAPMFVLALVLTWLMESSRTIWAAILTHALHNAVMIAVIVSIGAAPP